MVGTSEVRVGGFEPTLVARPLTNASAPRAGWPLLQNPGGETEAAASKLQRGPMPKKKAV